MEFTKDELYEIEKTFDILAFRQSKELAQDLMNFSKYGSNIIIGEHVQSRITNSVNTFDVMRTISAKCKKMRQT